VGTDDLSVKRRLSEKDCSACYDPMATYQDSRGAVWVLGGGPPTLDRKLNPRENIRYPFVSVLMDGRWSEYRMKPTVNTLPSSRFGNAITEDKDGAIWIYHRGLFKFDIGTEIWQRFGEPAPQWDGFRDEILATPDGRIWLIDRRGAVWTFKEK